MVLWEFEFAANSFARDDFWSVDMKAQCGATDLLALFCLVPPFCLFPRCRCRDPQCYWRPRQPATLMGAQKGQAAALLPSRLKWSFQDSLHHCLSTFPWEHHLALFIYIIYVYCLGLSCWQAGGNSDLVRVWCKEHTWHFQYIKPVSSILALCDPAEQSSLLSIPGWLHPSQ